jgi:hypothetical protein
MPIYKREGRNKPFELTVHGKYVRSFKTERQAKQKEALLLATIETLHEEPVAYIVPPRTAYVPPFIADKVSGWFKKLFKKG